MEFEMVEKITVAELKSYLRLRIGSCHPSDRINDPPHKVWICIMKKAGVIKPAHCD